MTKSPSSTSSAASADSPSGLKQPDLFGPSPSASKNDIAKPSCGSTGPTRRSTTTCEPCPQPSQQTLSVEDSHAPTSAMPGLCGENETALMVKRQDYGMKCAESFARLSPDGLLWKTYQQSFIEEWETFCATWPRSGMMQNGIAYRLPTLAHPTYATASSLLPTPTARDYKGARSLTTQERKGRGAANSLPDWFRVNGNWQYPPVAAVECMMGFPIGHTDCERLATAFLFPSQRKSGGRSSQRSSEDD